MPAIFQFITMAFPKAGILFGDIPITVSTVLFGMTLIHVRKYIFKYLNENAA